MSLISYSRSGVLPPCAGPSRLPLGSNPSSSRCPCKHAGPSSPFPACCGTFGPQLGRPRADTLNGSRHAGTKELRFSAAGGQWRVAFAFDPTRRAVLLVAGDMAGSGERFDRHLARLADEGES